MNYYKNIEEVHDGGKHYYILMPEDCNKKYPIVYAFHGTGGADEWLNTKYGNIKARMEKLSNEKSIEPMIIVMPIITSKKSFAEIDNLNIEQRKSTFDPFFNYNLKELIDHVNNRYSKVVKTGSENTCIAGFSVGATTAIYHAIHNDGMFNYIGGISISKYAQSMIPKDEFVINNNKGYYYNFIGYGDQEGNDFIKEDKYCINRFVDNECEPDVKIIENGNHNFGTFSPLMDFFFSMIFRKTNE